MKHLARKHVNGSSQAANKFLRVSLCKEELYAYIIRILGNSMCLVKCFDGYERLCHIRGKFTGRSKRENALSQGTVEALGALDASVNSSGVAAMNMFFVLMSASSIFI